MEGEEKEGVRDRKEHGKIPTESWIIGRAAVTIHATLNNNIQISHDGIGNNNPEIGSVTEFKCIERFGKLPSRYWCGVQKIYL